MPPPIQTHESTLITPDNFTLYTKTWLSPTQPPLARVAFLHGFSDHCNFYTPFFPLLATQGIQIHSFDQRGWGRSVPTFLSRGRTGPTSLVLSDIDFFLRSLLSTPSPSPLFLMGHSMGGAETLVFASQGPASTLSQIRGFLVEAPFIALHSSSRPWDITVKAGRALARLAPNLPLVQKLAAEKVSRDKEVVREFVADRLCHDTGTLEGLAGMLERAEGLERGRVVVREGVGEGGRTRVWIGHGTGDEICGFEEAREWFERLEVEDKEMRVYEGWYHKLHMEPGEDKGRFAGDVARWILERCGEEGRRAKL